MTSFRSNVFLPSSFAPHRQGRRGSGAAAARPRGDRGSRPPPFVRSCILSTPGALRDFVARGSLVSRPLLYSPEMSETAASPSRRRTFALQTHLFSVSSLWPAITKGAGLAKF